jgi:hypothetical protein
MRWFMEKTAFLVLLLVYLLTPYSMFGLTGGGCDCSMGKYKCGEDGYACCCCKDFDFDFGTPTFEKCRMGAKFFSLSQPPAVTDLPYEAYSFVYMHDLTIAEKNPASIYLSPPERPPAT